MEVGNKYGRLTIAGETFIKKDSTFRERVYVTATCECGVTKDYLLSNVISLHTKSCGCLYRETKGALKHGLIAHPLFSVWRTFRQRCNNKNNKQYANYGGRGISVCKEWDDKFEPFYEWAISHGWENGLELDREKNNGNYEPSNCRFVTSKINNRNKRNIVLNAMRVHVIKILRFKHGYSYNSLAKLYGASTFAVRSAAVGKTWA